MNENGKVLVVDNVIPPCNDPGWGKLLDINMLIIGGRERTKNEFAAIFAEAGLKADPGRANQVPAEHRRGSPSVTAWRENRESRRKVSACLVLPGRPA